MLKYASRSRLCVHIWKRVHTVESPRYKTTRLYSLYYKKFSRICLCVGGKERSLLMVKHWPDLLSCTDLFRFSTWPLDLDKSSDGGVCKIVNLVYCATQKGFFFTSLTGFIWYMMNGGEIALAISTSCTNIIIWFCFLWLQVCWHFNNCLLLFGNITPSLCKRDLKAFKRVNSLRFNKSIVFNANFP